MKRRSSPSNENNKEPLCQNTCSNNRKKQRSATAPSTSTTPPRPLSDCQSLPRKLHHSTTTNAECRPSQPTLKEVLLARKYKHPQPLPPATSTSKIARKIGKPMHSSKLQPQRKHDLNAVTLSDQPAAEQQSHSVEIIHPDALSNLTELYSKRTRMLNEMLNFQKRLQQLETKLIEEGKQSQSDPSNNKVYELKRSVDRLEHNLMKHVQSLNELITRTRTPSSSSDDYQDQNQDQGRAIETETAKSVREGTWAASSEINDDTDNEDTNSEDDGQQQQTKQMDYCPNPNQMCPAEMAKPKDKKTAKTYGIQDTIQFLNQTLTYSDGTITSLGTHGSSGSSGYATATASDTTGTGSTDGLLQIEALTIKAVAAISDDKKLLGPVIRKPILPGRVACPYCGKDLAKSYLKQHIRKRCTKSSGVARVNDEAVVKISQQPEN